MMLKNGFSSENKKTFYPKLIIASTVDCADLLYAGGFHASDPFVYYENGQEKCLMVSPLEYARALGEAREGVRILDSSTLRTRDNPDEPLSVALSRRLGIDCWQVPARFPLFEAEQLMRAGIRLKCCPEHAFFPEREFKTPAEIVSIREAERTTEEQMRQLRRMLEEARVNSRGVLELGGGPLTCEFLRSELEVNFKRRGYTADRTIVSHGAQCAEPHNLGSGPILAGEPVVADIFPRCDATGYWGDMTRTFVKGKADPVVKRAYQAVLSASEAAKKYLHAGVTGAEAHAVAAEVLRSAGFVTGRGKDGKPCGFFHGLGHGVGLEIHESPRLSPSNPNPLHSGNVVSVEPGLYDSEWGGVRLEDLVVITSAGCECLNTMEMELEIP